MDNFEKLKADLKKAEDKVKLLAQAPASETQYKMYCQAEEELLKIKDKITDLKYEQSKKPVKEELSLIRELLSLNESKATKFKLQTTAKHKNKWEDLADEEYNRDDVEEFFKTADDEDAEYRAVGIDAKETLTPPKKVAREPNGPLARKASPEVHKRNAEFFKKHL